MFLPFSFFSFFGAIYIFLHDQKSFAGAQAKFIFFVGCSESCDCFMNF